MTSSLRDIGYDFFSAVADLVDNSIAAGATTIDVVVEFDGPDSFVLIADDGTGMTQNGLVESLRFGSRRSYEVGELGRYGLGLKTASLSQCRSVTVCTRRAATVKRISTRTLDLDVIIDFDDWLIIDPGRTRAVTEAQRWLNEAPGTVVVWSKLDRVLPDRRPEGGWARRRFESLAVKTAAHLSMVFHRFLAGTAQGERVVMTVNGEKLQPWDPFAPQEQHTVELAPLSFEVEADDHVGTVRLRRFVLPPREKFSMQEEFDRLSGPLKWNRQQGLYVYRADRLVQWGGWAGVRSIDEHTKLARVALDFNTDLDAAFHINVAKMRVNLPTGIRQMLERPLHEVCLRANDTYRRNSRREAPVVAPPAELAPLPTVGLALRSAAAQSGDYAAFKRIVARLKETAPEVAESLNF
ncbi:ATP-binding protein [Kineococcus sp. GCM10028916]|uniref:ATP-binding protein n=1 Tax=Kineococcus sp. GCM10028916 TaxID=3273394 RepID=UPI003636AAE7